MTLVVVWLLKIPVFMLVGGLVLVWIAFKLVAEGDNDADEGGPNIAAKASVRGAVQTIDGQPFVTPTSVWRQGDRLFWHGSSASRALRSTPDGTPVRP